MSRTPTISIEIVSPRVAAVHALLLGPAYLVLETPSVTVRLRTGGISATDSRALPESPHAK